MKRKTLLVKVLAALTVTALVPSWCVSAEEMIRDGYVSGQFVPQC